MHDELVDGDWLDEADRQRAAEEALDARVVEVLETHPQTSVPADFAARVAGRVAASVPMRSAASPGGVRLQASHSRLRPTRYGYAIGLASMVVLLVTMPAYAPRAMTGSTLGVTLEWAVCAQFALLAVWFGLRREELR